MHIRPLCMHTDGLNGISSQTNEVITGSCQPMFHPGLAENIAPDGGPGSDIMRIMIIIEVNCLGARWFLYSQNPACKMGAWCGCKMVYWNDLTLVGNVLSYLPYPYKYPYKSWPTSTNFLFWVDTGFLRMLKQCLLPIGMLYYSAYRAVYCEWLSCPYSPMPEVLHDRK